MKGELHMQGTQVAGVLPAALVGVVSACGYAVYFAAPNIPVAPAAETDSSPSKGR